METNDAVLLSFKEYWRISEEMIARASKEDLAVTARVLSMQAAHYAATYGEIPITQMAEILAVGKETESGAIVLRDGAKLLTGVLGSINVELLDGIVDAPGEQGD